MPVNKILSKGDNTQKADLSLISLKGVKMLGGFALVVDILQTRMICKII